MTASAPPAVQVSITSREGGAVAYVTIAGPKLNIIGSAVMREFLAAMERLTSREDLRAVVLTGAGEKAFIGGADIGEMVGLDQARAREFITLLHRMCASLRELPVPVIGRINGYALGAGLEVAAACDLRIAGSNAVFGMPEVRVGIPSVIEAALLPSLIGWGRTRRLLLLAETLDAKTAHEWGLVERVVPPADLNSAVDEWIEALLRAGARAIRLQKQLIRRWEDLPLAQAVAAGIDCFAESYASDEPARMMRAFIERPRSRG